MAWTLLNFLACYESKDRSYLYVFLHIKTYNFFVNINIFLLNRSHEEDDKEDEAVKCYESILNIDPDHKDAKRSIDRIKGLEKDLEELGFKDVDYKFVHYRMRDKSSMVLSSVLKTLVF